MVGIVGSVTTVVCASAVGILTAGFGAPVVAAIGIGITAGAASVVGGGASVAAGVATHLKVKDYELVIKKLEALRSNMDGLYTAVTKFSADARKVN